MERFITEYANYQKKTIKEYNCFSKVEYKLFTRNVDTIIKDRERGLLTIDDAMQLLHDCAGSTLKEINEIYGRR